MKLPLKLIVNIIPLFSLIIRPKLLYKEIFSNIKSKKKIFLQWSKISISIVIILGILLTNAQEAKAQTISRMFDSNLKINVVPDGISRYNVNVVSKGNLVFNFNTRAVAGEAGDINSNDIFLHQPSNGKERFVGIKGIGKNDEIYYLMHLIPSGQNEWIVDSDIGSSFRCYGCGLEGLKTRLFFNEGVANFDFFVNNEAPCKIKVSFENGQWRNSDPRGFCTN